MRGLAATLLLAASGLAAQEAPYLSCTAVESLVALGLVDGGIGGDTGALSAMLDAGDPAACLTALKGYGLGTAGLWQPDCAAVLTLVAAVDLPEADWPGVPDLIRVAVAGEEVAVCTATLAALIDGDG